VCCHVCKINFNINFNVSWQRGTALICCCVPSCGVAATECRSAVDRYILFTGSTAANTQHQSVAGEWDRHMDGHCTVTRPCWHSAYLAGSANEAVFRAIMANYLNFLFSSSRIKLTTMSCQVFQKVVTRLAVTIQPQDITCNITYALQKWIKAQSSWLQPKNSSI